MLAKLDFSQPVGVLCVCALHFVPDEEKPHQIIAGYRDHLAPGSYLAITHGITAATPEDDPDGAVESVTNVYQNASAQIHVRPVKDIERFFDGFEIIEPGVVWTADWRPDHGTRPAGRPDSLYGGVGRKAGALAAGDQLGGAAEPGPHSTADGWMGPTVGFCQSQDDAARSCGQKSSSQRAATLGRRVRSGRALASKATPRTRYSGRRQRAG